MPELPEAEVARRGLTPCVLGQKIQSVLVRRRQSIRTPLEDARTFSLMLRNREVLSLDRRGKALVFVLDAQLAVVFHFKLGAFIRCHDHYLLETGGVAWNFVTGNSLEFSEMGLSEFHLVPTDELTSVTIIKNGVDPLSRSFTGSTVKSILPANRQLKAALIDQSLIAGIGNTYSDEILWRARIMPTRKVSSLVDKELDSLVRETKVILREAIRKGGEVGFRAPGGREGRYQPVVHKQAGLLCPRDGAEITLINTGRKTYYCPQCQK